MFRQTNPRVLENKKKRDELHERFSEAMNANDLTDLRQIILDYEIVDPISEPETGLTSASSTSCSKLKWGQLPMAQWRFICARKQLRAFL